MSHSEDAPLERDGVEESLAGAAWKIPGGKALELNCGACPKSIRLDARGELVHADGTPLCLAEERVFPSLDQVLLLEGAVNREVDPQLSDEKAGPWEALSNGEGERPRGFAIVAIVLVILFLSLGCVGYALMALRAAGVSLP